MECEDSVREQDEFLETKNADFILIILYENHRAAAGNLFLLVETSPAWSLPGRWRDEIENG